VRVLAEGKLVGVFEGYEPAKGYALDNCETWEQVGNVVEHVYRERPECRLLSYVDRCYIDVAGTSGVAEVRSLIWERMGGAEGVLSWDWGWRPDGGRASIATPSEVRRPAGNNCVTGQLPHALPVTSTGPACSRRTGRGRR
jgi:hypothetical protein